MMRKAAPPNKKRLTLAEQYIKDILSGKILACKKIKKLCSIMDERIKHGYKSWHYDRDKAERVTRFIEKFCYIPSGKIGQPFILEPYEAFIIQLAFGFVNDEGLRQFTEVFCVIGRKNGKTSISAALQQYMLVADGEGAPQVYSIATTEAQASLCYGAALKMYRQSKLLKKRERTAVVRERKTAGIICDPTLGYITTLSANPKSLDGLDIHFAVCDEIAAWKTREAYDLVKQATSARTQPMIFEITTNGFVRNSIMDSQYEYAEGWLNGDITDDHFLPIIYELDSRDEDWTDERIWIKANPGVGTVKKHERLRESVNKAKQDNSYVPTLLTKDFNLPQNESSAWLTWEECGTDEVIDFANAGFRYGIVGFDAADSIDLTCAQLLCMRPNDNKIYEKSMYWLPSAQLEDLEDKGVLSGRDYVPYRKWESQGFIRIVEGNTVPKSVLLDWLIELRDDLDIYTFSVGFDPWHMDDNTLQNLGFLVGKQRVNRVRQGVITLSEPMKQLRADYKAKRIIDNKNPINRWCRMNVAIKQDINGNIQPVKNKLNPLNRIDGFMAELDAYVTLINKYEEYQQFIQ